MEEFISGCRSSDPKKEPEKAAELLRAAAELGEAILANRKKQTVNYQQIVDLYNQNCGTLPKVTKLTDKRKRSIKMCIAQGYSADDLTMAFRKAASTPFLTGKNERGWRAGFDFIIKPDNLVKIIEDVYGTASDPAREHSYDLDKIIEHAMNNVPEYKERE